jgi:hypothetical protein
MQRLTTTSLDICHHTAQAQRALGCETSRTDLRALEEPTLSLAAETKQQTVRASSHDRGFS